MKIAEFLRLVWPEDGPYLIGMPVQWVNDAGETKSGIRHFPFDSIEEAAERALALAWDRVAPKDCFFALGSLVENRRKQPRKADNINRLRAFWLDLDVDADPKKYTTQKEALAGLKAFVDKAQLPIPHIVSSGYGVHVYWPLAESIDKATWLEQAGRLKHLTKVLGLKVDHSRTSDCASILRPVGTANWKREEPREVKLLFRGAVSTIEDFSSRVDFAIRSSDVPYNEPVGAGLPTAGVLPNRAIATGADINREAGAGNIAPPSDPRRVVKRCLQLSWQLANPNEVSEPSWYDMVGCLRHCTSGPKAVHLMSKGYSGYSAADTDEKIAHHIEVGAGPTLCDTFEDHNPGGCEGCPHKGKIRSPISLGYRLEQAEGPKGEVSHGEASTEVELPEPPYPFQRVKNPNTGEIQIAIEIPSADGEPVQEIIYERDLYPYRIVYDERESKFKATMRRLLPKDGWGEFTFPLGDLFDRRSLAKLLGNIGVLPDSGRMDTLVQYMIGYLKQLQNQAAAAVVYAQLGWRDDAGGSFVLPDRVVSSVGEKAVTPSSNIENALAWDQNPPRGDLEVWKSAVAGYNREGLEALQFLFGVGFAAPLFRFTPYAGMVISAVGPSGCGKSTAALCANSIWGHPHMGWADVKNDTIRAFYNKLGVLRHLPVTYDEITNLEPDLVSDLCYAVSKGRGRQRLEQDGSAKANHGDWQTLMITTSNASLHSKLSGAKADASAEAVRVFEFYVPPQVMSKAEADAQFLPIMENFGVAGPVYAKAMVEHTLWVRNRVKHWSKRLDKEAGVVSSERFWSAGAACVLAGFDLANKAGLTEVDTERVFSFAVSTIQRMRTIIQDNTRTPVTILADYLNGNLRNTLIVSAMPEGSRHAMVTHAPSGELRVRYELWTGKLYIDRAHFRRFCVDQGLDIYQLRRALLQERILVGDQTRIVLGRNTTFTSAQTNVWTIDMHHPTMSGVVQAVTEGSAAAEEVAG